MALLNLSDISLQIGERTLFDGVTLGLEAGSRACLLGRNGEGKSTLLKVIAGEIVPEGGEMRLEAGRQVAYLPQEPELPGALSVFDAVAEGIGELGSLVTDYHRRAAAVATDPSEANLDALQRLQQELEARDGWRLEQQVESVVSRLELPADARVDTLSGGWQRRVALGRALVAEPDLLLLDEPTNHLDMESVAWLEQFLVEAGITLLFISHDRRFLDAVATEIWELDRGALTRWPGNYSRYLELKEAREAEEARHAAALDRKLAQEEAWIRQGIKARRKRNQGRVRALHALREQRRQRVERQGNARMRIEAADTSGKRVFEAEHVDKRLGGKPILADVSLRLLRGDRVGLIGPNGAGKTTLLRVLLGDLDPDRGRVRRGTHLEVAYFDQHREQLDPEKTPVDVVAEGAEHVDVGGRRRHVMGYLQDFLFTPERARTPVRVLSGGERNRLLLARLFTRPANLLILDEPTNDLDLETLEVLESLLADYTGTVLIVSHDRAFLENTVTGVWAFEGGGRVRDYVGGVDDWLRQRREREAEQARSAQRATAKKASASRGPGKARPKKLGYREQRELEALPAEIERLENELDALQRQSGEPDFYRQDAETIREHMARMETVEAELATAFDRWETLEAEGGA